MSTSAASPWLFSQDLGFLGDTLASWLLSVGNRENLAFLTNIRKSWQNSEKSQKKMLATFQHFLVTFW